MSDKFNVLLSFPRSGNTWLRYIMEFISKRPTCQAPAHRCVEGFAEKLGVVSSDLNLGVDITKKVILIKRHSFEYKWDDWTKANCRLVLLVRSYKEAILRHAFASKKSQDDAEIDKGIRTYMDCLSSYDAFNGQKICIYYEDLIINPKKNIGGLVDFLGVPKNEYYDIFFKDYEKHKEACLRYYKPGAMTRGKSNKMGWHSEHADPVILNRIMAGIRSNKRLYNKYLKRYG
ncbi:MAG: hypothetical protein Q8P20_09645 [bacterium]|nr:hypothetical protein [bacterium]